MTDPPDVMVAILVAGSYVFLGWGAWLLGRDRLRRWWRRRRHQRRDFCEVCGVQPRRIHVVRSDFDDDDALGMEGGRSFMTATYCRRHAPSGARRKPNPRR